MPLLHTAQDDLLSKRSDVRNLIPGLLLAATTMSVAAADAVERKFISAGMDEGQVLLKIGKPDHDSLVSGHSADVVEKKWTYFPAPRDAQTMTIVTIRNGKVHAVERKIAR